MHQLRNRLIAAFLAATVLPLAATIWIATSLLDRSLGYATTGELDRLSRTLESTVRQLYQRERDALRQEALAGAAATERYTVARTAEWPDHIRTFWNSGEQERFALSGVAGDRLDYMRRDPAGVETYSRPLNGIRMEDITGQFRQSRQLVESIGARDLRRGFTLTLLLLLAVVWTVSLAPLIFLAHRISRPIQQLTAGLTAFAGGDWARQVTTSRNDEVGRAVKAFNHMAEQLRHSRERLVHLTQIASWQSLARKTAHELKNSLTPIRLTVEEMAARQPPGTDRAFMDQAVQIVVSEIETLERRVRAFSEFSSEPAVNQQRLDLNTLVSERVSLLKPGHGRTATGHAGREGLEGRERQEGREGPDYELRLDSSNPHTFADADLVKGILTNLLQNAAEAAGPDGSVLAVTRSAQANVILEVHDSGSGIGEEAAATLFEPTITFKKHGMGLGLSIAKRNALLSNGDIALIPGELGGAAFRVTLPADTRAIDPPSAASRTARAQTDVRPRGDEV